MFVLTNCSFLVKTDSLQLHEIEFQFSIQMQDFNKKKKLNSVLKSGLHSVCSQFFLLKSECSEAFYVIICV